LISALLVVVVTGSDSTAVIAGDSDDADAEDSCGETGGRGSVEKSVKNPHSGKDGERRGEGEGGEEGDGSNVIAFDISKLKAAPGSGRGHRGHHATSGAGGGKSLKDKDKEGAVKKEGGKDKGGKVMRDWGRMGKGAKGTEAAKLDYSDLPDPADPSPGSTSGFGTDVCASDSDATTVGDRGSRQHLGVSLMDVEESEYEYEEEEATAQGAPSGGRGGSAVRAGGGGGGSVLGAFFNRLSLRVVGSAALSSQDLKPALEDMKVSGWVVGCINLRAETISESVCFPNLLTKVNHPVTAM
jgi:hypothetical protein